MDVSQVMAYLKPGYFVRVQASQNNLWSMNTFLKVNRDSLVMPVTNELLNASVLINDFVKCKFNIGKNIITLTCMVEDISLALPQTIKLKIIKIDVFQDMRESARYEASYFCKIIGIDEKFEYIGIINDLSESGAAIICKDQINMNSNIKLVFTAFGSMNFSGFAQIARTKKTLDYKIEYGLRFFNLTEDEKQQILVIIKQERMKVENLFGKFCSRYGLATIG
ncbi:PilZ domain-containing protein [Pseudobacteroides cellulosolvens]|uniref:Type IV pilus assembly PilZ n=2 Tax=Pseudobacteroides cellulosolvens TaxID=35825 RepID=A0A0L6JLX2_9FIRM|nr:PilZ domain-containing protein [Pseudobacteroides cellulosolvens]KNY26764.1 type IV pilus assembly PilZ [Pseudobacteroides cellulosolvens ATCC 35603 = DSM 2933]